MTIQTPTYKYTPSKKECETIFAASCVESVALALGEKPSAIYERMNNVGLIHDYIIACYDTLHTESRENVTADLVETLQYWEKKKGAKL